VKHNFYILLHACSIYCYFRVERKQIFVPEFQNSKWGFPRYWTIKRLGRVIHCLWLRHPLLSVCTRRTPKSCAPHPQHTCHISATQLTHIPRRCRTTWSASTFTGLWQTCNTPATHLQRTFNTLQHTWTHYNTQNTLYITVTHCNKQQHPATHTATHQQL